MRTLTRIRFHSASLFLLVALVGLAVMLGLPAAASAATPDVTTFDAYSTGATTATVEGLVDPGGESTTYAVKYDSAASTWCTSGGASGSPAHTTGAAPLDFTDAAEFVSVDLAGLTEKGSYCAELIATNGSGEGDGGQVRWTQGAPTIDTFDAFSTDQTTAAVHGDVNPAGLATTYEVQYDTSSSVWCTSGGVSGSPANTTTATDVGFADGTFHDVFVNLSGLSAATNYCATVMASNSDGTAAVSQLQWTQGAPGAETFTAWSTGPTDATVFGAYNPEGSPGNSQVVYDVAGSTWCTGGGSSGSGSPAKTSGPNQYSFANTSFNQITVELTGLTEGTGYCGAMETTNAVDTTVGSQVQWTQGAPGVGTTSANATDATTASVFTASTRQRRRRPTRWNPASPPRTGGKWRIRGLAGTHHCLHRPRFHRRHVSRVLGRPDRADGGNRLLRRARRDEHRRDDQWRPGRMDADGAATTTSGPDRHRDRGRHLDQRPDRHRLRQRPFHLFGRRPSEHPVTLTATPAAGSTFSHWIGAPSCITGKTTCTITLFGVTSVGVVFTTPPQLPKHTLTVSVTGIGSGTVTSSPAGIDCGSTCSHAFTAGTQVTLTATPTSSSRFAGWSGGGCSGTGTCTVTMNADQTVTATFLPPIGPGPVHTCNVPKLKGKKLAAAKTALRHAHCAVGKITKVYSTRVKKGRVVSSKPGQGTRHRAGTKVKLAVSKGRKAV